MSWYCLHLKGAQEFNAEKSLQAQGYTVYLPRLYDHKKEGDVDPLFPCYCFINLVQGEHDFHSVKNTKGVRNFANDQLVPVPDFVIDQLSKGEHQNKSKWQTGDKVRLTKGAFKFYEAVIKRDESQRIWAVLELLGSQQIRVEPDEIEPA